MRPLDVGDAPVADAEIHDRVAHYYTSKVRIYGATPRGVDWRDREGQNRRFDKLCQALDGLSGRSVVEIGCGYGGFVDFCAGRGLAVDYVGYDISEDMIEAARARHAHVPGVRFAVGATPSEPSDVCIASGLFNVRFDYTDEAWWRYVVETIDVMAEASRQGFAFNILTAFSDPERMEPRLYYADPGRMLAHCIRRFGRNVAIFHDYGLYEFTVAVRTGTGGRAS